MTVEDGYGIRMNPISKSNAMESIMIDTLGNLDSTSTQQQSPSTLQNLRRNPLLRVSVPEEASASQVKHFDPMETNFDAHDLRMEQMQSPKGNPGLQNSSSQNKRKSPLGLTSNDSSAKKVAQWRSLPNSSPRQSSYVPNNKNVPTESMSNSPRSLASSKKKLPIDTTTNRSQTNIPKNRNVRGDLPSKAQPESANSVRSKLRESLAAALALVSQERDDIRQARSKELGEPVDASHTDPAKTVDASAADECRDTKGSTETIDSKNTAGETAETWKYVGQDFQSNPALPYGEMGFFGKDELLLGNGLSWEMELDVNASDVKQPESGDVAKVAMPKDAESNDEQDHLCAKPSLPCPDAVASEIEAELFKLFEGVNKKYKEKARSLLFNLKDKSNPELRGRVMSGEISPERLCSMTAEELASKELSEWRIAKAEEFDHMKVLPDTDVDLRRLVKKTHKGEFEVVEVDRDVGAPVDIGLGTSMPSESRSEVNKDDPSRAESSIHADEIKLKVDARRRKTNFEDQDGHYQLTIPGDSGDIMHGLMVEDIKDLPPIVSLDEFMESLDKEPPFEILHDSGKTALGSGKVSDVGGDVDSSDRTSRDPGKLIDHKADEVDSRSTASNATVKSPFVKKRSDFHPAPIVIRGERTWEGVLQINISSTANFVGVYKSGEKTGTREWPRFFEIKGRVRLDAFQKFLQDLPMSRSRAVMVVNFVLAEGSTETDSQNLQEVVDSYVVDERLGFAEPAPGFEIYFIPPHTPTLEMLSKQLTKDQTETLKSIENGLIGFVIWRKAQLPPPTTPKDNPKTRQHHYYPPKTRLPDKDSLGSNVNFADTRPPSVVVSGSLSHNNVEEDEDDDVPPGFGPPATNDDDLPEFNFSGGGGNSGNSVPDPSVQPNPVAHTMTSPTPSSSVDQVRELIQRYGKTENNGALPLGAPAPSAPRGVVPSQRWNDEDDDDDIPEWNPDAPPERRQLPPPPLPPLGRQQPPMLPPHMTMTNVAHLQQPLVPLAKPMHPPTAGGGGNPGGGFWHGGPASVRPDRRGGRGRGGRHQGSPGLVGGQQGRQWRSDGRRSRGRGGF